MSWNISTSYISECPCRGCEERKVGCHGVCEKYKEYRAKIEDITAKVREKERLEFNGKIKKRRRR